MKALSKRPVEAGTLKPGAYVIIDNVPCKVVEAEKSKPGKHGSAKVRVIAIGLFDDVKRSMVVPADQKVDQPIVEKRTAQVISVLPSSIQLMDLTSYEVYEVPKEAIEASIMERLTPGIEVEVWDVMGIKRVVRTK
ncbi:MAG: translation initiation factor IF-5A [Candidatus Nezhaarchaeales archaeon]